ncbi:uncharacterized protein LOC120419726 [Culex pipiens pallens]|uniref:uncharacterized protein LOC120419726 n=1 Tax=Culex pipiens pallens TaxID=42434 RepID=UPI0019542A0C|nr:uncharacterized protein LOC120419726 [Culex pipiens pallens]
MANCQVCGRPDTGNMAPCCKCGSWLHFECIEISSSIVMADQSIICPCCLESANPAPLVPEKKKPEKVKGSKAGSVRSGASSVRSATGVRTRLAELKLKKLEEQKKLALQRLELEEKLREAELAAQKQQQEAERAVKKQQQEAELAAMKLQVESEALEETFRLMEEIERAEDEDDGKSVASEQSSRSKVTQWQKQQFLSSTRVGPAETAAGTGQQGRNPTISGANTSAVERPAGNGTVLDRALKGISLNESGVQSMLGGFIGRVSETIVPTYATKPLAPEVAPGPSTADLSPHPKHSSPLPPNENSVKPTSLIQSLLSSRPVGEPEVSVKSAQGNEQQTDSRPQTGPPPPPGGNPQPVPNVHESQPERYDNRQGNRSADASENQPEAYCGPTAQQLVARQVITKELPVFTGDPEDWPLFISAYVNTTNACGYSNAENLSRLQKYVRGYAYERVRGRLLHPTGVPHAIAMLEMLFGRPEILIHSLLEKVRSAPAPRADRLESYIDYGLAVQHLCDHLETGGHEAHLNNPMLLFELVEKLPPNARLDWSLYKERCEQVNISAFARYMSALVKAASDVTLSYGSKPQQQQTRSTKPDRSGKDKDFCGAHSAEETSDKEEAEKKATPACFICKDPKHRVKDCAEFAKKMLEERWKIVDEFKLCHGCLGIHWKKPCRTSECGIDGCRKQHHALLHSKQKQRATDSKHGEQEREKNEPTASGSNAVTNHHYAGKTALFRIIPVELHGNNRSVSAYAFLDDGSSRTMVDEEIAKELGVEGEVLPLCLQWTANVKRTESASQRIALEISGDEVGARFALNDVRTVKKLELPRQSLRFEELAKTYPYLQGLPVKDYDHAAPRILIGNDNAYVTAMLKVREGQPGEPIAARSRLGWTVYGKQDQPEGRVHSFHVCECQDDQSLHDLVKEFFSVESMGVEAVANPESEEVKRANKILQDTTKRVGQRFETGLLWKYDCFEFPDSYPMAKRRLQCLERRIQKDPVIGESVVRQLSEYQEKGYIHKATPEELEGADPSRTWYLPLGVALNPKKPSKIRIFCDAAAKVNGISLNTMLLKGPDLLKTLLHVLFGFREKRVALCADLKEMFHQVQIRREDRHAQRLLWRDDPSKTPEVYLMDVATFGATCSPCSAQYIKNRNAEEHAQEYPEAADAIIRKHYVDDYLDSADTVEEATKLALEVKHVHSLGGFDLRNWLSNSKEVLARVGESDTALEKCIQLDKNDPTERVLGMFWKPEEDVFTYTMTLTNDAEHPTKRQALRIVMSLFDPAGLLCFFIIHGKILIQEVWRAKTEWDQKIPDKLRERWMRWIELFEHLCEVRIPRCYFPKYSVDDIVSLQLHVFCDASEEAYSCVAYFRAVFWDGVIQVALVGGKAKVAPLKALSIPRLELSGGVLGVRLRKSITNGHSLKVEKTVMWTDSKTVLAWINSDHRNYRQFVACRVGEILSKSDAAEWRHCPGKLNPADLATKWGPKGPCFSPDYPWYGRFFLLSPDIEWPMDVNPAEETTEEELRACLVHIEAVIKSTIDWKRFSDWTRLLRAVAYALRFKQNIREKVKKQPLTTGPLTQEEMGMAETAIFRTVQSEAYPDEVATLSVAREQLKPRRQAELERTSSIRKLSPFMDEAGLIRSDSRISEATFASYDTRFPIILPKSHPATNVLLFWYHRRFLHANGETVVNEVRQRFFVSMLRTEVRKIPGRCPLCKLKIAMEGKTLAIPRMAPLPAARLQAFVRPFSYTGIDYFGPIAVRVNRGTQKRWIALFTCLTTRAVHLEVVHSLTTESCKQAFRRFIGRRGAPAEIRSDRGTNFVGANNELRQEMNKIDGQLAETFTNTNTRWIFNPPAAPHMGGAWERLVRSVKTALTAMYTSRVPNEETLATLVVEAESIVNSRPLTFIPLQSEQQEALTPNHFLLLSSSGVVQPPKTSAETKLACRGDWQLCQTMLDNFWRRWIREYLPTIARRTKWFEEVKPIEVGDLVIVVEEKVRNGWIRGRIVEAYKGRDGRIRDATVQTADGLLRRPVAKLARLDLEGCKPDPGVSDQLNGSGNCSGAAQQLSPQEAPRRDVECKGRSRCDGGSNAKKRQSKGRNKTKQPNSK